MGPLTEFRFNDQLIWALAVGLTLSLLPAFSDGRNAGFNLLLFFGALYAVRGLGVLAWISKGRYVFIIVLSLIAIIYGAIVALVQPDLKKLIAYSSVSHMGFVTLGIFIFQEQGLQGAILLGDLRDEQHGHSLFLADPAHEVEDGTPALLESEF